MNDYQNEIVKVFGNKLRLRVCGICIQEDKILLVKHHALNEAGVFWSPPGGGQEFGESAEEALIREFEEETGLKVAIKQFLFVHEFYANPLHAIELFFEVSIVSGSIQVGTDPELNKNLQILHDARFFTMDEIRESDPLQFHNILPGHKDIQSLLSMKGYFRKGNF